MSSFEPALEIGNFVSKLETWSWRATNLLDHPSQKFKLDKLKVILLMI
jgi:hypothetical protein